MAQDMEEKSINMVMMHDLVAEAAEEGANRALTFLGLADDTARRDIDDLRELLSAWRDAKNTARNAVIAWAVRVGLALLLIGLAVKLGLPQLVTG